MKTKKPKWTPKNAGSEFTSKVVDGLEMKKDDNYTYENKRKMEKKIRKKLTVDDYVKGVLENDRTLLARTITLIESNSNKHMKVAQQVIKKLLPDTGNSIRIGVTGVPGAGKSTFIEALGSYLTKKGHKIAVLAVDPTSSLSRGSILGDKTRMEKLAKDDNCFVRPSPSGGNLGGVTRKTRETILACEAAGYDVVLIETVGVGQSEITVRSMVDFFLLLKIAGAGDELQGIKKGIIEIADAILINKADGPNKENAEVARAEFERALHYLTNSTKGWETKVKTCSALNSTGIKETWQMIKDYIDLTKESGYFRKKRKEQLKDWLHELLKESILNLFYSDSDISEKMKKVESQVVKGEIPTTTAVKKMLDVFQSKFSEN